jgi:hypothetical protein
MKLSKRLLSLLLSSSMALAIVPLGATTAKADAIPTHVATDATELPAMVDGLNIQANIRQLIRFLLWIVLNHPN